MVRPRAHAPEHFGCQHNFRPSSAALREPSSDNLFCPSLPQLPTIHIGCIKEINAEFQRSIHDRETLRLAGLWTEIHCAQAEWADFYAGSAEMDVFHRRGSNISVYAKRNIGPKQSELGRLRWLRPFSSDRMVRWRCLLSYISVPLPGLTKGGKGKCIGWTIRKVVLNRTASVSTQGIPTRVSRCSGRW